MIDTDKCYLIFFISILYFIWIRSLFRPVRMVTENIKNIIDRKKYATIRYPKNEFSPLLYLTINNLQKTLSIQEKYVRTFFQISMKFVPRCCSQIQKVP